MGLTIHYSLQAKTNSPAEAKRLLGELRKKALDLPFQEVGELIEFSGDEADFRQRPDDDPYRWLLIQAQPSVTRGDHYVRVKPERLFAFSTRPGDGCEPANFGLGRYPKTVEVTDRTSVPPRPKKLPTSLDSWCWGSFCKTQYASAPQHGGIEHFLRCHLAVIKLLDQAKALDILKSVSDESDYWEKRDLRALAAIVGDWNTMIAGWAGRLKDAFGEGVAAPIAEFPNFERLEAEGRKEETKRDRTDP